MTCRTQRRTAVSAVAWIAATLLVASCSQLYDTPVEPTDTDPQPQSATTGPPTPTAPPETAHEIPAEDIPAENALAETPASVTSDATVPETTEPRPPASTESQPEASADSPALLVWESVRVADETGGDDYARPRAGHGGSCPSGQHVDHVVPLKEAYASGLTGETLARFNTHEGNHRCLPGSVNMSKGSSEPHEWLSKPKAGDWFRDRPDVFCDFVVVWVAMKSDWRMTADAAEHAAVSAILADDCTNGPVSNSDGPADTGTANSTSATTTSTTAVQNADAPSGCVHWHSGHDKHTHPGTDHDSTHATGKCAGY